MAPNPLAAGTLICYKGPYRLVRFPTGTPK